MSNQLQITPPQRPYRTQSRRAAWRQRLVEAESGIKQGFRSDSTLFVHFFLASVILTVGLVLGISLLEWTIVVLSVTLVLSAEMFQHVVKAILGSVGHHFDDRTRKALRIGTAAVFVAMTGATLTVGLIFGRQLMILFGVLDA